jgi:hypothetical protein
MLLSLKKRSRRFWYDITWTILGWLDWLRSYFVIEGRSAQLRHLRRCWKLRSDRGDTSFS